MSATTPRPKKTRKTFTGCWTCRSRKIKCDEARPACEQCTTKNLCCEGYGVRLHWVTESMDRMNDIPAAGPPKIGLQRSKIVTNPIQQPLRDQEIDSILTSIDTVTTREHGAAQPLFIHNFGVFDLLPSTSSPSPCIQDVLCFPHDTIGDHGLPFDLEHEKPSDHRSSGDANAPSNESSGDADGQAPHIDDWLADDQLIFINRPTPRDNVWEEHMSTPSHFDWHPSSRGTPLALPMPTASSVTETERFLMHHYKHRVVNLFCVIDNKQSPWKQIHLPKALQSIGDLVVDGSSTVIRDALRTALLSISAFCLCSDSIIRQRNDDAAKWTHAATHYRGKSIQLLKAAVEKDLHASSPPKYKDFLATMLSMITINVISGDTSTCKVHLDGAFRLMTLAKSWKRKYSPKAQSLHRVYLYLRVIFESTAFNTHNKDGDIPESERVGSWVTSILDHADLDNPAHEADYTSTSRDVSDLAESITTCENIYGVPQALLVLLSETTQLITDLTSFRQKHQTMSIPDHLFEHCNQLEATIMDLTAKFERHKPHGMESPSASIIRKTTSAFQNALVIYFAQHVRLLGYQYLQPFVEAVLTNIKEIELIKAEKQILAAPLYWPAFIAGSEAFDATIQAEFKAWYKGVEVYGIEFARTGIIVLDKVWQEGCSNKRRFTSHWVEAVQSTGVSLMLT